MRAGVRRLGFRCMREGITVTELLNYERGDEWIDEHHLYLVEEPGGNVPRLEVATLRHGLHWSWPRMERQLRAAGFADFTAHAFTGAGGCHCNLVVARRV